MPRSSNEAEQDVEALARVMGEHSADMSDERLIDGQWVYGACCECGEFVPLDYSLGYIGHIARTILASPWLAAQIAAAEQRGREDNADHRMCYVAGSEALAARERQAGAAVEAARDEAVWHRRQADHHIGRANRAEQALGDARAEAERLRTGLRCLIRDWSEGWEDCTSFDQRDAYRELIDLLGPDFNAHPTWIDPQSDTRNVRSQRESPAVPLLGGLLAGAEDGGDPRPGATEDTEGGDLSGYVGVDVPTAGDEGLEVGLGGVHASSLVDGGDGRQDVLTPIHPVGLGARIERLLNEHWPNSGVNAWYLADLLRDRAERLEAGE